MDHHTQGKYTFIGERVGWTLGFDLINKQDMSNLIQKATTNSSK